jgi:integrase
MIRSLPLAEWPQADRTAWLRATVAGQRLRRGGPASHLATVTRTDLERRYGSYLRVLHERGRLQPDAPAGHQVTAEGVEAYLARAHGCWRSTTIANSIYKLRRMADLLAPDRDHAWLREIENDLALVASPQPRFDRLVTTEVLVEAGLALVKEAEMALHLRPNWRAARLRDGLMVALLALCPIRLKNLVDLRLGESLRYIDGQWWIVLSGKQTKAGRPDERPVPDYLNQAIASYLTFARPLLLKREFIIGDDHDPLTGPLWVGEKGAALGYSRVEQIIMETTRLTLGVAVSPHDFRRAAATTAAYRAGDRPHLASALLQHTHPAVTHEHYNRASNMAAALDFSRLIRGCS